MLFVQSGYNYRMTPNSNIGPEAIRLTVMPAAGQSSRQPWLWLVLQRLTISMRFLLLAIFLFSTTTAAFATDTEPAKSDRSARADAHWKMRMDYAASPEYNPYASGLREIRSASAKYLESGDFEMALRETEKGLAIDHLNIDLLMTAAAAARHKGDIRKADELRQRWMSLVDSIVDRKRGDGKSFATAFQVISVDEEYAVLAVSKLGCTKQLLIENNGSEFDILTVKGKNSEEEFDLYFNIDIPKGWLNRHLGDRERMANQPPLQTPTSSTPAASASAKATADKGAPVAPARGAAGL